MSSSKKKIAVGETFIVKSPYLDTPTLGRIVVITSEPGRIVGMKLAHKVSTGGDLNGRVERGYGVWAHPAELFTEEEFKADQLARARRVDPVGPSHVEYHAIEFDPITGNVVEHKPADAPAGKPTDAKS